MPNLIQLTYISSARGNITSQECNAILSVSRINNSRLGVSGALLFNSKRFLQTLEGEEHVLQALFEKISADPRHAAVVMLNKRAIEARQFGPWAMGHGLQRWVKRDGSSTADRHFARWHRRVHQGFVRDNGHLASPRSESRLTSPTPGSANAAGRLAVIRN